MDEGVRTRIAWLLIILAAIGLFSAVCTLPTGLLAFGSGLAAKLIPYPVWTFAASLGLAVILTIGLLLFAVGRRLGLTAAVVAVLSVVGYHLANPAVQQYTAASGNIVPDSALQLSVGGVLLIMSAVAVGTGLAILRDRDLERGGTAEPSEG